MLQAAAEVDPRGVELLGCVIRRALQWESVERLRDDELLEALQPAHDV
jgi:hypothetical protein